MALAGPVPPLATDLTSIISVLGASSHVRPLPDCGKSPLQDLEICNISLSPAQRATSLISLFTIEEKLNSTGAYTAGVPRLGIPPYVWWNEGLHGLASSPGVVFSAEGNFSSATSFPQPILSAAAFDDGLIHDIATAIGYETRAFANAGRAGLDLWTPNVNPFRDPRWGRGKETPGEDAFHVSSYTKAFVAGLEGPDNTVFKRTIATCKHFAAYDLENFGSIDRYNFDAVVSTQDLAEFYTPPFKACTRDADAGSVMCSYNALNGLPTCADPWLLETLLRDHWNWEASDHYVTSDCAALDVIITAHKYTNDTAKAAALSLKAGTDVDCGVFYSTFLPEAFSRGLITESDLDRALIRLYTAQVRMGYYDPPQSQPYRSIEQSAVNTPATQHLAYRAATSGMTLLKNLGRTLPLSMSAERNMSVALVGDWGNATTQMLAGYSGIPPFIHSPLYGLQQLPGVHVNFVAEINNTEPALHAASLSDVVIYVGGIDESIEREAHDRTAIAWNSTQLALIDALAHVGKPLVVVQTGGGQLDDSEFLTNENVSAILWAGYPGQDGGRAIADVLFGRVAPAGRLPITQYPSDYIDKVKPTDMSLRPSGDKPGRTYKWFDTAVLPFGYGLHYTNFSVIAKLEDCGTRDLATVLDGCYDKAIDRCPFGTVQVSVNNIGDIKSDYAALAFVSGQYGPAPHPIRELVAYNRLHDIQPGQTASARLPLTLGSLARWDQQGHWMLYNGTYRVAVDTAPELTWFEFTLTGEPLLLETFPERPAQG